MIVGLNLGIKTTNFENVSLYEDIDNGLNFMEKLNFNCLTDMSPENWKMYLENTNGKRRLILDFNTKSPRNLGFCPNTGKYGYHSVHKIMIKNANFFVLIVLCLRTHQRKKFTTNS